MLKILNHIGLKPEHFHTISRCFAHAVTRARTLWQTCCTSLSHSLSASSWQHPNGRCSAVLIYLDLLDLSWFAICSIQYCSIIFEPIYWEFRVNRSGRPVQRDPSWPLQKSMCAAAPLSFAEQERYASRWKDSKTACYKTCSCFFSSACLKAFHGWNCLPNISLCLWLLNLESHATSSGSATPSLRSPNVNARGSIDPIIKTCTYSMGLAMHVMGCGLSCFLKKWAQHDNTTSRQTASFPTHLNCVGDMAWTLWHSWKLFTNPTGKLLDSIESYWMRRETGWRLDLPHSWPQAGSRWECSGDLPWHRNGIDMSLSGSWNFGPWLLLLFAMVPVNLMPKMPASGVSTHSRARKWHENLLSWWYEDNGDMKRTTLQEVSLHLCLFACLFSPTA